MLAPGDTASFTQSFNNKNVGTTKTVIPAGSVNDGNSGNNYNVTFGSANVGTITARTLTVIATASNKVYDATTTVTVILSDDRVAGDSLTVSFTSANFSNASVGNGKTVNVTGISLTGTDAANYTFNTTATTTANITKKNASVTPNAASKFYGDTDPTLTGTLNGFLAADGVTATYSRTAGENVAASPYTISAVLSPAAVLGNYEITYNTALLTIKKAPASVVLSNMTQTYTGSALTPTATTTPAGLTIVWTNAPQTNAGSYSVTATVNDLNYEGITSASVVGNMTRPTRAAR